MPPALPTDVKKLRLSLIKKFFPTKFENEELLEKTKDNKHVWEELLNEYEGLKKTGGIIENPPSIDAFTAMWKNAMHRNKMT